MRTYHITLAYQHKGSRYPRNFETPIIASSAGRAANLAFQAAKRNGEKIREREDGEFVFRIFVGAKVLKEYQATEELPPDDPELSSDPTPGTDCP